MATVKPAATFDASKDALALRDAMKGLGTNEKAIIDVLCKRSNAQRLAIEAAYKTDFGKDLKADLKSELSARFEDTIIGLLSRPADFDATQLHKAVKGLGTDEETLSEILASRTNHELMDIKTAYKTLFKHDLEKDLTGDTSGNYQRILVSMVQANRPEGEPVDVVKAKADAEALINAGVKKAGTDETVFNMVLCSRSFDHIRKVCEIYQTLGKNTLEKDIESELSGDVRTAMRAIVTIACSGKPTYFAKRLNWSMKGAGTHDQALIRLVISRCEVDMVQIKQEFQRLYGKSLSQFISEDTSGDYKNALLTLVGA